MKSNNCGRNCIIGASASAPVVNTTICSDIGAPVSAAPIASSVIVAAVAASFMSLSPTTPKLLQQSASRTSESHS